MSESSLIYDSYVSMSDELYEKGKQIINIIYRRS